MDLSSRAMLVSLTIKAWSSSKIDKDATADILTQAQAQDKKGAKVSKSLVSKAAMAEIKKAMNKARSTHYELTSPWGDDKRRILPSALFTKHDAELRAIKDEFEIAVRDFIAKYDDEVKAAHKRLGALCNPDDYPDIKEVEARFSWDVTYEPLTVSNDFRTNLSKEITEQLQKEYEKTANERVQSATKSVWERAIKTVEHMANSLDEYKVVVVDGKEKVQNTFHASLVENVKEIAELLPSLNITNDPAMNDIAARMMERLTQATSQELKEDKKLRATTAKDARKILAEMQENMGGF